MSPVQPGRSVQPVQSAQSGHRGHRDRPAQFKDRPALLVQQGHKGRKDSKGRKEQPAQIRVQRGQPVRQDRRVQPAQFRVLLGLPARLDHRGLLDLRERIARFRVPLDLPVQQDRRDSRDHKAQTARFRVLPDHRAILARWVPLARWGRKAIRGFRAKPEYRVRKVRRELRERPAQFRGLPGLLVRRVLPPRSARLRRQTPWLAISGSTPPTTNSVFGTEQPGLRR